MDPDLGVLAESYGPQIAILVDDMVDTGRTLTLAAKVLEEKGAMKIYALVSHGKYSLHLLLNTAQFVTRTLG